MYVRIADFICHMFPGEYIDINTGCFHTYIDTQVVNWPLSQTGSRPKSKHLLSLMETGKIMDSIPKTCLPMPVLAKDALILEFLDVSVYLNTYMNNRAIKHFIEEYQHAPNADSFRHDLSEAGLDRFGSDSSYIDTKSILSEYDRFITDQQINAAIKWCEDHNIKYTTKS